MQAILDLQKMEAPTVTEVAAGSSCTSSWSGCCGNSDT
jgi:hypothetical protein